jgi:hypothetical protein
MEGSDFFPDENPAIGAHRRESYDFAVGAKPNLAPSFKAFEF